MLTVTNEPSLGLFSYLLTHAKKTDIVLIAICYEFKKTMEKFMMSQFLGLQENTLELFLMNARINTVLL